MSDSRSNLRSFNGYSELASKLALKRKGLAEISPYIFASAITPIATIFLLMKSLPYTIELNIA
ncbi:MAG: hypothetical protein JRM87_04175 [Nitrososphaerota archaeon]|nr:hypothetical protein [Nitrososphaerota archaeon]